ncbi:hypothetical protein ACH4VT_14075 [Streptomyces lydicus]|uniref:hypothetical protein n=1 Tax=Streptomyces lydicus TaxID=47763 RepID=UPI00379F4A49
MKRVERAPWWEGAVMEVDFPVPRIGPEWARRRIGAFRDAAAFERIAAEHIEGG